MRRTTTLLRAAALLAASALIASACGGDDDTATGASTPSSTSAPDSSAPSGSSDDAPATSRAEQEHQGGSVVFAAEQWPQCINPVTSCANSSWANWTVFTHVLPRLMELTTDGTYQASPLLTEAPTLDNGMITQDPFTITYHLAPDAVWSDGTPITAADVQFTWHAVMETTGTLSTAGFDLITDITSPDPQTAVISFSQPYAPWADLFGGTGFLLKADEFTSTDLADTMLDAIPFSGGPWILQSWSDQEAVLVRNERYWAPDRATLFDQVTFVPREDTDTEIISLQTGEVAAIFPQPSPGIVDRLSQDGIDHVIDGGVSFEGLWPNQRSPQSPILADRAVREALAFAIDRQEIFDTVMRPIYPQGEVLQCAGWVPNVGDWCGDEFADVQQDLDKAAQILTDAGWARNADGVWERDGVPLEIEWNTVAGNRRREDVQALVQEQVADFGIRFVINNVDAGEMFESRLPTLNYGLGLYAQIASPDPSVTTLYDSANIPSEANGFSGQNSIALDDPRIDELTRLADTQLVESERLATIRQIDALLREQMAWIPLYQLPTLTAWRTDQIAGPIGEWTASPYGGFSNMYDWYLVG